MGGGNSAGWFGSPRLIAIGTPTPFAFELSVRRIAVGGGAGNELRVDDATVSRRHALIERRWGRWSVRDLGSTNGTYVNGRRVGATSITLRRGDELRFGSARFGLVRAGADLSKVGARAARPARRRRTASRIATAAAVLLLFVAGFGATEYLMSLRRAQQSGRSSAPGAATPPAITNATPRPVVGGAVASAALHHEAATGAGAGAPSAPAPAPDGSIPQWLARVNYYRAMVKLAPVREDPALSDGERNHTRYLVDNYAGLIRRGVNTGAEMHSEDPARPGYSPVGFRAAQSSDIDEWPGPQRPPSPTWAIDDWITGAFHRLNILNPGLREVAYGLACNGGTCAAALDVLTGAERPSLAPRRMAAPIEFPPAGASVALGPLFGEWPDPLSACPGYQAPAGLPVTLQLGSMFDARLSAYRLIRDGDPPITVDACGFDATTYISSDDAAQHRARRVLFNFGAVVLVPRSPLRKGASYTVSMSVDGREYKWSFSTEP